MHKCTSLAIHDDTGIAKLLFILTTNGATDRDSVYSCIIYFTVSYLYICGVIYQLLCCYVCIVLLYTCCTLSENDEIKLINQSINTEKLSKTQCTELISFLDSNSTQNLKEHCIRCLASNIKKRVCFILVWHCRNYCHDNLLQILTVIYVVLIDTEWSVLW